MEAPNPYQSPKEVARRPDSPERFDPENLPIVFRVPFRVRVYWCGMTALGMMQLVMGVKSLWFARPGWFSTFFACVQLFSFLTLSGCSVCALCSRIEISRDGIRSHMFRRRVVWSDIRSWKQLGRSNRQRRKSSRMILTLVDGRKRGIFGPATSVMRNGIVADALGHFVGPPKTDADKE